MVFVGFYVFFLEFRHNRQSPSSSTSNITLALPHYYICLCCYGSDEYVTKIREKHTIFLKGE